MQAFAFGGIALFLPLIRTDIGMTFSQAGALAGASTLVFAAMQVPSGYLADRFGPKRLFIVGLLGVDLMSLTFSMLHSYDWLLVNQAMSGLFRSLVFAPGLLLISSLFAPQKRATAMGLYVAGGFSSNILLSSVGPLLVGPLGWRTLFVAFSLTSIVVVVTFWRVGGPGPLPARSVVRLSELGNLLRMPVLWVSGGVQFVRYAVVNSLAFWLPTYLVVEKGLSLRSAGLVVAVSSLVTAPSNYLGGWLSDRLQRPAHVVGAALSVLTLTLFALTQVRGLPALLAVIAVQSIFVQFYFGPLFEIPIRVLGTRTAGLTSGWSNFCANVGGLGAVYALGRIRDVTGSFAPGVYGLVGLCVLGLVGAYHLARIVRSSDVAQTAAPLTLPSPLPHASRSAV
jgi:nitrate/nitrite transporter NarK